MLLMVARLSRRARTTPRRSPLTRVTPALSIATSVPVPIAMPTCGLGQRRRVVDAVAGHGDDAALGLEPLDLLGLLVGEDLGADLVEPEPARDGLGRRAIVAGEHDEPEALARGGRRSPRPPTP